MIEKPPNVRAATSQDSQALFDLLCVAYKENAPFTMSDTKVRRIIDAGSLDRELIIGLSYTPNDQLAGAVGAAFAQDWYSDDWYIGELFNFVHPDHRQSDIRHGKNQINYLKWIAENMNMALSMGILTATRMEAKIRMYGREMQQVGALFTYNAKAACGPIGGGHHG